MNECERRDQAWPLFLKTHSALVEILESELQAAADLPLTWFEVLLQLQDAGDGRRRMNDLADSLLLSKSGITRLIDRMSRAGFIERKPCDSDRRVVYAAITRKGRNAYKKAAPVAFRGIERHFTRVLGDAELRTFRATLEKLLDDAGANPATRAAV